MHRFQSNMAVLVALIAVAVSRSDSDPPEIGAFPISLDAYNASQPRHMRCAAEVLSSLDWYVAPEASAINANTSVVTGTSSISLPFQFQGPAPFDVLYRGCFSAPLPGAPASSLSALSALMAAYNSTSSQFRADVVRVAPSFGGSVTNESTRPEQRRWLCLVACTAMGYYTSREVLVGSRRSSVGESGAAGDNEDCGCAPVGSVAAVFGNITFTTNVSEGACLSQNGSVLVYEVDLYCFPTSVDGQWCNSGCQPRGQDACCYPGVFVPAEDTSPGSGSESPADDSGSASHHQPDDVDYYLQVALLSLLSFAVVEGIGFWIWLRYCSSSASALRRRKRESAAANGFGRGESDWMAALTANSGAARRLNDMETELLAASVMQQCEAAMDDDDDDEEVSLASRRNMNVTSRGNLAECTDLERALFGDAAQSLCFPSAAAPPALAPSHGNMLPMGEGCCPICLDVCAAHSTQITHLHCGHLVHRVCFKDYVKHRVRENAQKPIKCPVFGCTGLNASAADPLL